MDLYVYTAVGNSNDEDVGDIQTYIHTYILYIYMLYTYVC